jgi:hypothetical protein
MAPLDPRLEEDPRIRFLRQCEEEQRADIEFKAAWKRDDIDGLRLAADRLTALHRQTDAYALSNIESYRD